MKYILLVMALITTACRTQSPEPVKYSVITFNFYTQGGASDSFRVWNSKKVRFNGRDFHAQLEMRENNAVTFTDGTSLYYSRGKLFLNRQEQNLAPGNYILRYGRLYPGHLSSYYE